MYTATETNLDSRPINSNDEFEDCENAKVMENKRRDDVANRLLSINCMKCSHCVNQSFIGYKWIVGVLKYFLCKQCGL